MIKTALPIQHQWLTLANCELLYGKLNQFFSDLNKKIGLPPFSTRYFGKLESVLGGAQMASELESFDQVDLFLYYLIKLIKRHPFVDGNKRMAVICSGVYLTMEDLSLTIDQYQLYNWAILIAQSDFDEDELRKLIKKLIIEHQLIVPLKQ